MGQTSSRHRPDESSDPTILPNYIPIAHIPDDDTHTDTSFHSHPTSHHNSDLHNQGPLPRKPSTRRSFLGTLRSPLRSCSQRTSDNKSHNNKRWTFHRRRKSAEPSRIHPEQPQQQQQQQPSDELQQSGPSRPSLPSTFSSQPSSSNPDSKGKAKEDDPAESAVEISSSSTSSTAGPSSTGSSTMEVSQPDSVPFEGPTTTDLSSPSTSASASAPSTTPRDPALNHDPTSLPSIAIQPDATPPEQGRDNSEAFNVMERPATPPEEPPQPPPPEPRRNFPAAGTLVVVQGVVHTSDVSQTGNPEPSEPSPRRASSVPPPGERRQRLSEIFSRPIRSRRSSYATPESTQSSSDTSAAGTESESQEESSPTETLLEPPAPEEPPIPQSRPLSLSPTSIDVLGTLLSVATAATAASLVSGSTDPLMSSGLALPPIQGSPQQPAPPPAFEPSRSQSPTQGRGQTQSRPLSPTPNAGIGMGTRDRVRSAFAGLRDRFGLASRPSTSMTPSVPPPAVSPPPDPEPTAPPISGPSPPTIPVDPRTQLLTDMARAFHMGMGLDDGTGSGSRSSSAPGASPSSPPSQPASPAADVNLGEQQQGQQQPRPPPPEDSFERFLLDLQVDLRRTLEEGQPETEPEPEPEPARVREQEREAQPEHELTDVPVPPSIYPREATLSTNDQLTDFGEELPALPQDDDDENNDEDDESVSDDDEAHAHDEDEGGPEEEAVTAPAPASAPPPADVPSSSSSSSPSEPPPPPRPPPLPQAARRTIAGSERRPGGINWWRMYRFPPMVVPHGAPPAPPWPPSPSPPAASPTPFSAPAAATTTAGAAVPTTDAQTPPTPPPPPPVPPAAADGNTVVPVIVVGLQSVHGHGHGHGAHRHTEGGHDEHHPPPQLQQQQDRRQSQDGNQDDHNASEPTRDRERRWSTRAAEAFRGLRQAQGTGPTTRREGSGSSNGSNNSNGEGSAAPRLGDDGHGSTTFFIYVIGGYYPPNHQLVIGTDPLDSFEELAELLGHVKPQTATREDIDNSGLEVIRPSVLTEYEKVGRIAPMCVDRCLICLEDYNPEEDLRLLTCRHVFHKECVDRWLETGRNNCPACRSQGVTTPTTGSGPIPMPPSP